MTEAVYSPIPLSEPSARPASEIGWARAVVADRGLKRLGDAVNSLIASRFGQLIMDVMDPADLPLTPSDPLGIAGIHRRWMVKTPSRLDLAAPQNKRCTLQVRIAKGTGAGLQYKIFVGGAAALTYSFASGGLAEQWVTLTTALELDDAVDYQEIMIEQTGWHGGSAATDYCRAVRLMPNVWSSIRDQADGWRFLQVPVPVSVFGVNDAAATWLIQAMQRNLRYLYARRVPTLYASSGIYDASALSTLTEFSKLRVDCPEGVQQARFWFYAHGPAPAAIVAVNGYANSVGYGDAKSPASPGWVSVLCDVSPRGAPLFRLAARETITYSVCAYCEDAVYEG